MRRTAVLLGLGLVATWGVPALAATAGVRVGSFYFEDASAGDGRVTVAAGDRIRFTFEGNAQHTATVDALFDSGQRSGGETYTTGALAAGTYSLYCQVHGAPNHATTLVVRAAASPPPPPSASPSPSPSPRPSPTAKASPRVSPTPSPRPAPASAVTSPAASPAASTSAAPTSSPIVVRAAPSPVSLSPQAPTGSPSATASPLAVEPRGSATSSGTGWGVPVLFVLGVLLAAVGTVVAARGRRTP